MIITANISRIVNSKDDKRKVEEIVVAFGGRAEIEDFSVGERYHYSFLININYNPVNTPLLIRRLNKATDEYRDELSFDLSFYFENEDYSEAPLFNIISMGNKASLYNNSANQKFASLCNHCKIKKMTEQETLKCDTGRLRNNPIILVDHKIVVSESLAIKMSDSDLSGYKLIEVQHAGEKSTGIRGFAIIPTSAMPPQCLPIKYQTDPTYLSNSVLNVI
jgi:hypothetical protein